MREVTVSVIVPVYNVRGLLERCMESLLSQRGLPDEIILVDDGSTDGSGDICDNYAAQSAIVKVIHKENGGLGYARNSGLSAAEGDLIAFVDSDDHIGPDMISTLKREIGDADAVFAGYTRFDLGGAQKWVYSPPPDVFGKERIRDELIPRMTGSLPELSDAIDPGVTHSLYRSSLIREHGLHFPSEREYISEDLIFNLYFLSKAEKIVFSDNSDYHYFAREGSLTLAYRADRLEKAAFTYKETARLLGGWGMYESAELRLKKGFFIWLRMCVAQEKRAVSGKDRRSQRESLRRICDDPAVREIIEGYPLSRLGLRQRIFLEMIKRGKVRALAAAVELGAVTV